jgi:hypothetical protein
MRNLYLLLKDIQNALLKENKKNVFKRDIYTKINWSENSI